MDLTTHAYEASDLAGCLQGGGCRPDRSLAVARLLEGCSHGDRGAIGRRGLYVVIIRHRSCHRVRVYEVARVTKCLSKNFSSLEHDVSTGQVEQCEMRRQLLFEAHQNLAKAVEP